jgi:hypothetical protein
MRFLRENSLSIAFGLLFLASLVGQSVAGWYQENQLMREHHEETVSYGAYVLSSSFGVDVLENWQSEYLQFSLFILATIWLHQRGSNESKPAEDLGLETDEQQKVVGWRKDWRYHLYANSLLLVMAGIFFASWFGQGVTGWREYNDDQHFHDQAEVSFVGYLGRADFWDRTLQNWQSEFLAVGSMAVFTIYLRQRGSPESKPVGSRHDETGAQG